MERSSPDAERFISEIKQRCTYLHDNQSFKERILEPAAEYFRSDATAVLEAKGVGFDLRGIHFGYPARYAIQWANQDVSKTKRFQHFLENGVTRGFSTLRAQDTMPDKGEEYDKFFTAFGQNDSVMTMFFSSGGQPLGIYGCNRFKNPDMVSRAECDTFDEIAPYIFNAFLKYRWLLDIDFFNIQTMDDIIYGVITLDKDQRIVCMNRTARQIVKGPDGKVHSKLPGELVGLCDRLERIPPEAHDPAGFFRDVGAITPFGNALCFRYDREGSKYVSEGTDGMVLVIDPRFIDRDKASALSPRELEVSRCLIKGLQDKEIAHALKISEKTVQTYVRGIFKKLGTSNRTEAAILAVRLGLI